MGARRSWRSVKLHRTYTFEEAERLLGVHRNTIRNWVRRDGLEALVERKPYLIRGDDLREFLRRRAEKRRQPLGLGEMFCLSCRKPRKPERALVENISGAVGPGHLRGLCPVCLTLMHRRISRAAIPEFLEAAANA